MRTVVFIRLRYGAYGARSIVASDLIASPSCCDFVFMVSECVSLWAMQLAAIKRKNVIRNRLLTLISRCNNVFVNGFTPFRALVALLLVTGTLSSQEAPVKLKPLSAKELAMTCRFDAYTLLPGGYIRYTYMRCLEKSGEVSQWMRVPDHQTSERREVKDSPAAENPQANPVLIPEVQPLPVPDLDDPDDSAVRPHF